MSILSRLVSGQHDLTDTASDFESEDWGFECKFCSHNRGSG